LALPHSCKAAWSFGEDSVPINAYEVPRSEDQQHDAQDHPKSKAQPYGNAQYFADNKQRNFEDDEHDHEYEDHHEE
jgi:hypothetical protein